MLDRTTATSHVFASRGGIIETSHNVHAAVVSSSGALLYHLGDPHRVTPVRSAIKPYQSLAILESDTFDKYAFDDADLALMCSSHSSEDSHVDRAKAMLDRVRSEAGGEGITEDDLACGGHESLSHAVNRTWVERRYHPRGIDNNCSGKHVGMIAAALAMGTDPKGYEEVHHPLQQRVVNVVQREAGPEEQIEWGIDGCNLPTPAMEVRCLAKLYAQLAESTTSTEGDIDRNASGSRPATRRHLKRVYTAMAAYPEQVSGVGRFDHTLASAFNHRPATSSLPATPASLVGKVGADGVFGIAVPPGHSARDIPSDQAFGIAVKVEDGNEAALYVSVVEVLRQLGMSSVASADKTEVDVQSSEGEQVEQSFTPRRTLQLLDSFARPVRLNSVGKEVGRIWPEFQLLPS